LTIVSFMFFTTVFTLVYVVYFEEFSGEEASVSLGYALRTTDRLTPPIRASKTEAPPKTRWNPKMKNLGMNQRNNSGRKKEKDQKQSLYQLKNARNKMSYNAGRNEAM
jgi:hypothetical protein